VDGDLTKFPFLSLEGDLETTVTSVVFLTSGLVLAMVVVFLILIAVPWSGVPGVVGLLEL